MSSSGAELALNFRAGRMTYENGIVSPCLQQGNLSFTLLGDYVNMQWTSHSKSMFIPLPKGKTKVSYVEQCKTGRVLLFEVSNGPTPALHFFWLQNKSIADDAEHLITLRNALVADEPAVKIGQFEKILSDIAGDKEKKSEISLMDILISPITLACIESDSEFFSSKLSAFLPEGDDWSVIQHLKSAYVKNAATMLSMQLSKTWSFKEVSQSFGLPKGKMTGVRAFLELILGSSSKKK